MTLDWLTETGQTVVAVTESVSTESGKPVTVQGNNFCSFAKVLHIVQESSIVQCHFVSGKNNQVVLSVCMAMATVIFVKSVTADLLDM